MATGKITKRAVDALAPNGGKQFLWDEELRGFGLQVTPAGAKSYVYQYRTGGREAPKRRYTIGRHGSPWTPATAREECERLATIVSRGGDPADEDRERRRILVDLAFASYVPLFVDGYLKARWRKSWQGAERVLIAEAVPVLKNKPLPSITRGDLAPVFDRLKDRPAVARHAFATLRKLFRWAEGRGDIARGQSPIDTEFLAPPPVKARDRVLRGEEVALAWEAAGELGYPFGPMIRLLFSTGQRREEAAGLDWAELDQKEKVWSLPADRAKNGLEHIVPLNPLAVAVLDDIASIGAKEGEPLLWPRSGLVFTTTGKTAVSGHSRAKRRLDAAISKAVAEQAKRAEAKPILVAPWRIHDIRRTVATGLQRLGIRFEVTEAVLNHRERARSGVAGVYQRHDWRDEKRAALDAWARHLAAIGSPVSHANVLNLPRAVGQ